MQITVRQLEPGDDRSRFASGDIELDRFFQRFAGQNQFRHHIGATYVAVDDKERIQGFATLSAGELTAEKLTKATARKLPAYPLPVLRLSRLAVAKDAQRQGVGKALMRAVFVIAHTMADTIGCVDVVVDAKADAVSFYEPLGFVELEAINGQLGDRPAPRPMFLELGAIPKL